MGLSVGVGHARSVKDATTRAVRSVLKGERVLDSVGALTALSEGENPLTPREHEACKLAALRYGPAPRGARHFGVDQSDLPWEGGEGAARRTSASSSATH